MIRCYATIRKEDGFPTLVRESTKQFSEDMTNVANIPKFFRNCLFMGELNEERVYVMALDSQMQCIGVSLVGAGGMTQSSADVRGLLQKVLLMNAHRFVLVHNHPSGSLVPSKADKDVYKRLCDAGDMIGIACIDSIIVTKYGAYTMRFDREF